MLHEKERYRFLFILSLLVESSFGVEFAILFVLLKIGGIEKGNTFSNAGPNMTNIKRNQIVHAKIKTIEIIQFQGALKSSKTYMIGTVISPI